MIFSEFYLTKYSKYSRLIPEDPLGSTGIIVIIPCYQEPDILDSLGSLLQCSPPGVPVEVIVVVNSSENEPDDVKANNLKSHQDIKKWSREHERDWIRFYSIYKDDLPIKTAGAGLARKIGMDEAVRRFMVTGNEHGIIVSFDADTLCRPDFLNRIWEHYSLHPEANACTHYFEHPLNGDDYSPEVYEAVHQYESHVRYYKLALEYAGYPYPLHTIGSCFSVKLEAYCKQGGMNSRQAGEDFYFLHKIANLGNVFELNELKLYPSPRPSTRVPFGTGPEIHKILTEQKELLTYDFKAFEILKHFFDGLEQIYQEMYRGMLRRDLLDDYPGVLHSFLVQNQFEDNLREVFAHSSNQERFVKRFYQWFNAFKVLKFLHFYHERHPKLSIPKAISELFEARGFELGASEDYLIKMREIERSRGNYSFPILQQK